MNERMPPLSFDHMTVMNVAHTPSPHDAGVSPLAPFPA